MTESDVRALARGSELVLDRSTIATPSALDAAFARGIRVVWEQAGHDGRVAPLPATLERMLANDGTYVVRVQHGRAVVTRLADSGPEEFGRIEIRSADKSVRKNME